LNIIIYPFDNVWEKDIGKKEYFGTFQRYNGDSDGIGCPG
jgi:hypothetical protein